MSFTALALNNPLPPLPPSFSSFSSCSRLRWSTEIYIGRKLMCEMRRRDVDMREGMLLIKVGLFSFYNRSRLH